MIYLILLLTVAMIVMAVMMVRAGDRTANKFKAHFDRISTLERKEYAKAQDLRPLVAKSLGLVPYGNASDDQALYITNSGALVNVLVSHHTCHPYHTSKWQSVDEFGYGTHQLYLRPALAARKARPKGAVPAKQNGAKRTLKGSGRKATPKKS